MGAVVVLWCNYDNKNKTREGLAPLQTKLDVVQTKLGVVEGELRELKTGLHSTQVLLFHVAQAMVGNRNELRALVEKAEKCRAVGGKELGPVREREGFLQIR